MKKFNWLYFPLTLCILILLFTSCSSKKSEDLPANSAAPSSGANEQFASETQDGLNESAQYLMKCGIIEANQYTANRYVSRIVAAQMVADITGLSKVAKDSNYTHPFVDLSVQSEHLIGLLYHDNIVEGVSNNRFMEDEICDRNTFLLFLLRALDCVGGRQENITQENVLDMALDRGVILSADEANEDGVLSVNEAFDICYNALYAYIDDGSETLLSYLIDKGIANVPASGDYNDAYKISDSSITPFYRETFDDKYLSGDSIKASNGTTDWYGSRVGGTNNCITDDGYLQLSGTDQKLIEDQRFALRKSLMQGNESYGMTFTVNVKAMANEGDEGRAILRIIPRTADADFKKYYAINYYMVLPLGNYQSNLARCKWSITNTNAPSGTTPLAEAYYLLKENVDYTARLIIENTAEGDVHIAFYIDGADRYTTDVKPLLEYTDSSQYKIMQSAAGPAFGSSGSQDSGWGYASTVCFDNIAFYTAQNFNAQTVQLQSYASAPAVLAKSNEYTNQIQYLLNHGILGTYQRNVDFSGNVSVAQFLASAMYLNGSYMAKDQTLDTFVAAAYQKLFKGTKAAAQTDLTRPITRYEAAVIIKNMMRGKAGTNRYSSLYKDSLDTSYADAVYFAVQNSYLLLDETNCFNGANLLTRQDLLRIMACAVDSRLRNQNYVLQVPSIYSDDAVLQAGKPILISGKGMSGDTVTVMLHGQIKTSKVVNGKWSIQLDKESYGGPYTLTIKDSGYTYSFGGIYMGEVFVVAGQSNAEESVYDADDNQDTLRRFNNQTQVRLFRPVSRMATTPLSDTSTKWAVARTQYSEQVLGNASAVGVFYVQELLKINPTLKNVKIGLIQLTYGGTSIELFMPNNVAEKYKLVQKDNELLFSGFWDGFMDGITPYSVKALIYYQGENSAQMEYLYEPALRDYIWGVRQKFGDPSLPIMLVQISGYGDNYGQDSDTWPYIREVQMRVANTTNNVGLVTAIDLADKDPQNIHPSNKRPIGNRLAYLAMSLVYGQDYGEQSSKMTSYTREGTVYTIKFNTDALTINENAYGTKAFEVLTPAGKWVDAQAKVEGNTLLVWNDSVIVPQGVRYAWSNYPKACLLDQNGLPVLPFNTTKDLTSAVFEDSFKTTAHYLLKAYYLLNTGDAVINLTRNGAFRHVTAINAYMVEYSDGDIAGQTAGDQIILLKKQGNLLCESGTTGTIIKAANHGLKVGDRLLNTRYNVLTEVLEVLDENTVRVREVSGQTSGNVLEILKNTGTVTAE